ncbi:MAG TPA: LptF/LptG family permease [Flavobacterium sp.]
MKILDKYILTSFVGTFITVFVILFFIFVLQTVWLFIAELAGKDLDLMLIVKFLLFSMPRMVPLVLPLSILLASIMTFGSFSENYEFAAMKSSGISLQRAMKSLTFFIVILAGAAFIFANNVIPYAEFKFINFRKDIAQKQPAMAIAEGQFSEVGTYTIKVDKKSGANGNLLSDVTIHKRARDGMGTSTVIKSEKGELISNEESSILKLVLQDGYYYEDVIPKKYEERKKLPFAKSSFKKYVINLDLSKLTKMGDDQEITNTTSMLNINELRYTLDSLDKSYEKDVVSFADNIYQRTGVVNHSKIYGSPADTLSKRPAPEDLLAILNGTEKATVLKVASSNVEGTNFSIEGSKFEMEQKAKSLNTHMLALYDKFVIAYACILMFFIGAPLGAIIRKGGLGLPIVFAVLIFITFHFINTFGKRLSSENSLDPFFGAWMSSLILTPLAVLLTHRATNDIGLINMDVILLPIEKLYKRYFTKKNKA